MQALPFSIILLIKVVLSSIRGISGASIKYIEENHGMECCICLEELIDGSGQETIAYLASCGYAKQHIFHAKCFAKFFMNANDSKVACPICRGDCKSLMRQALLNYSNEDVEESFQGEILEYMNALSNEDLSKILENMNFTFFDYKHLAENFENTQFAQINEVVAQRLNIFYCNSDLYRFMISENSDLIEEYNVAMTKCIASGLSESQVMAVLSKIAGMADANTRKIQTEYLIELILASPHVELPASDIYTLIIHCLKNNMHYSVHILLEKTGALHAMSNDQILDIFSACTNENGYTEFYTFKYVWLRAINLHGLDCREIQAFKQKIEECFTASRSKRESTEIKERLDAIHSQQADKPLGIDEAADVLKEMCDRKYAGSDLDAALRDLINRGVMRTIVNAAQNDRMRLFQSMLDSWDTRLFKNVYLRFPESMTCIDMDLAVLRRYLTITTVFYRGFIEDLARRQYFGYEALISMLDVLFEADIRAVQQSCIWLLLAAKHRGFLGEPYGERSKALIEKFIRAEFYWGVAFLARPVDINEEYWNKFSGQFENILKASNRMPCLLQEYILCHHADSCVFMLWCRHAGLFIRLLCQEKWRMEGMPVFYYLIIKAILESECFAKNAANEDVEELMLQWAEDNSNGFEFIKLFFTVARSEQQAEAAKMRLFREITKESRLSENNTAAMNAAGLNFELINRRLTYKMEDGSVKTLSVDGAIDEPIAGIIKSMDRRCFLKLTREIIMH